jgi:pimeloyl-ACP methyl ester carboxylesterase
MRKLQVLLAGFVLVALALVAAPHAARLVLAIRLLDELRRPGPDSWLRRATAEPVVSTTRLESGGVVLAADLYRPARRASQVPVVFVPGLVEAGKDEPRVAPFAKLLARAGFLVVVPDLPSLRRLRVHPDNLRELGAAIDAVTARPDVAPRGRAGLVGVSYAGGIALLAALDTIRAGRVPFVASIGAHADLDTALFFIATGRTFTGGRMRMVEPDPYGQLVFLRTFEEVLHAPRDSALLESMAARRIRDPKAPLDDLAPLLGAEARLVYELFEVASPDQAPEVIRRLPPRLRARLDELSPARRSFSTLRSRLYLAHARDDGTFPVSEAYRLAARARSRVPVQLVVLDALQHVDPEPWRRDAWGFMSRDLPEAARLAWWWYRLLGERR